MQCTVALAFAGSHVKGNSVKTYFFLLLRDLQNSVDNFLRICLWGKVPTFLPASCYCSFLYNIDQTIKLLELPGAQEMSVASLK